jgi:hypothetical protein
MPEPSAVVRAVAARIEHDELVRRLGRARAASVAVEPPPGAPPVTVLSSRSFPPHVCERRVRVMQALGWIGDVVDVCVPGDDAALPEDATLEDHVALVSVARVVRAVDDASASLAAAVGSRVEGDGTASSDDGAWDAAFDAAADAVDPAWRSRVVAATPAFAPQEAVSLAGDAFFGRRRRTDPWRALREGVRRAGETKRRFVG